MRPPPFLTGRALLAALLPAQHLVVLDPSGPGFLEMAGIKALTPGPGPPCLAPIHHRGGRLCPRIRTVSW